MSRLAPVNPSTSTNIVSVVNLSKCVNDVDGMNIVVALNTLIPTFCKDWSITQKQIVYIPTGKSGMLNPTSLKVFVMDDTDISGAGGFHPLINNTPYTVVYAKTILNVPGAAVLYESTRLLPTVSQLISHEVFELLGDTDLNTWWVNSSNGSMIAAETSDPVSGNVVPVRISENVIVAIADWVLPAWTQNTNKTGPYNHLDTLTAPFAVDPKGYILVYKNAAVSYTYGAQVSTFIKSYSVNGGRYAARAASVKTA
jgi:hypothetical protein